MDEGIPEECWELNPDDIIPLGKEIGSGSFGRVYLADYLGTEIAVKKLGGGDEDLPPLYIKREISILKQCRHPNIVTFMGIIRRNKDASPDDYTDVEIAMEYCPKGDLRAYLKREGEISWRRRVTMAIDIAKALLYLHKKSIIFRDLKAKNLLLDSHSRVKICDFGFARSNTATSRPKTICGTDGFLAPEVILGMDYDESADVFSFGMVLFEIITRLRIDKAIPRGPADYFGLNEEKVKEAKIIPPDAPEGFVSLAFWCCKYEPKERPDFRKVLIALNKILESLPQRKRAAAIHAPRLPAQLVTSATEDKNANATEDKNKKEAQDDKKEAIDKKDSAEKRNPLADKKDAALEKKELKKRGLEELKAKKAARAAEKAAEREKHGPPPPSMIDLDQKVVLDIDLSQLTDGREVIKVGAKKSPRRMVNSGSLFKIEPAQNTERSE